MANPSRKKARASTIISISDDTLSDDEQQLQTDSLKWHAPVYSHFHPAAILRNENGEKEYFKGNLRYVFTCKRYVEVHLNCCNSSFCINHRHPSERCIRSRCNDSTSALIQHVKKCDPQNSHPAELMERFTSGCSYRREDFHVWLIIWIVKRCRPFSIVDDDELRLLFQMLYKGVHIPSQSTISRHIKIFHTLCLSKVVSTLREYKGAIHIGLDTWTAGNGTPFMGITIHRCVDGVIQSLILDFIYLTANHSGEYLATEVYNCLERFGVTNKLLALAGDNASNNGTLIDCLNRKIVAWGGHRNRVRCLGHILSLATQVRELAIDRWSYHSNSSYDRHS